MRTRSMTWARTGISAMAPACRRTLTTWDAEYANSDFDIRHRFTLSFTYAIPGKKGLRADAGRLGDSTPSSRCRVRNTGDRLIWEPMPLAPARCRSVHRPTPRSAGAFYGKTVGLQVDTGAGIPYFCRCQQLRLMCSSGNDRGWWHRRCGDRCSQSVRLLRPRQFGHDSAAAGTVRQHGPEHVPRYRLPRTSISR